jgi:hypothetical protein
MFDTALSHALTGLALAALGATAACQRQTTTDGEPRATAASAGATQEARADSILRRSRIAARGATTPQVRTLVMEGTYEYTGANGQHAVAPLQEHWRAPGILYQEMRAPFGLMRRWSDGTRGWASRPEFPNRPLPNAEISEVRREAVFYQPAELGNEYTAYRFEGRRTLDGRLYDVVAASSRIGRTERFYFDPGTGLPHHLEVWEEGPEGLRSVGGGEYYQTRYTLSDYREVGGLRLPFHLVRKRPSSTAEYRFERIRLNAPVDTTRESPPTVPSGTVVPQRPAG